MVPPLPAPEGCVWHLINCTLLMTQQTPESLCARNTQAGRKHRSQLDKALCKCKATWTKLEVASYFWPNVWYFDCAHLLIRGKTIHFTQAFLGRGSPSAGSLPVIGWARPFLFRLPNKKGSLGQSTSAPTSAPPAAIFVTTTDQHRRIKNRSHDWQHVGGNTTRSLGLCRLSLRLTWVCKLSPFVTYGDFIRSVVLNGVHHRSS